MQGQYLPEANTPSISADFSKRWGTLTGPRLSVCSQLLSMYANDLAEKKVRPWGKKVDGTLGDLKSTIL